MNNWEWEIARRWLFSRSKDQQNSRRFLRLASLMTLLGVAFGVAALTVALSVISGFQKEYRQAILGFNSHLVLMKSGDLDSSTQEIEKLRTLAAPEPLVKILPFIYREGMAIKGDRVKGVVLKGTDWAGNPPKGITITKWGAGMTESELPTIVLGEALATQLGIDSHQVSSQPLQILFPQEPTKEDLSPWMSLTSFLHAFHVVGIFKSGLYEYDANFAFISLKEMQTLFHLGTQISGIEFWLNDADRAVSLANSLQDHYPYPYQLVSWADLNETIFRALKIEKILFYLIMTLLVCVASFNVMGSLAMTMIIKREFIAILRALGASWQKLQNLFMINGLALMGLGILAGFTLALFLLMGTKYWWPLRLAPEVYLVDHLPIEINAVNFLIVTVTTLLLGWVAIRLAISRMKQIKITQILNEARSL